MKKRFLSIILALSLMLSLLPTEAVAYFVSGKTNADSSQTGDITIANSDGSTGVLEYDESWETTYPYGAFVFGSHEAAASEDDTDGANKVTIPVYRLGGTTGRATVYIRYQPVISQDGEESLTYAYAASGRDDLTIMVEDPQPVAKYQALGAAKIYAGCELKYEQGFNADKTAEEDYQILSLAEAIPAEDYVWQLLIMDSDYEITQDWTDITDAADSTLQVENDIWFAEDCVYDFRCIYTVDGKTYCSASVNGAEFTETEENLPEQPAGLNLNADPTYSTLSFSGEYDVYDFEMTFAEGEWVKNIVVTIMDDDEAEMQEMGLFTLTGNEGGAVYHAASTMTLLIDDNDPFEPSELGFTTEKVTEDQDTGSVTLTVKRTGGLAYPVSVDYETVSGTAEAGKQFAKSTGTLMFAGDVDSIDITIPLIAEEEREEELEFTVKLSNIKGGGEDDLCSFGEYEIVTVSLKSSGKAVGLEAGLNLSSVLATASGEDVSGNAAETGSLLPETTIVTGTQAEDAEGISGEYTENNGARTYTYAEGISFKRGSSYSGYWNDWENVVGNRARDQGNTSDCSGNMNYYNSFTTAVFTENDTTTESGVKDTFAKSNEEIELRHNHSTETSSILKISDFGKMFSAAEWRLRWPIVGMATYDRDEEDYLYVMPYVKVDGVKTTKTQRITINHTSDGNPSQTIESTTVTNPFEWDGNGAAWDKDGAEDKRDETIFGWGDVDFSASELRFELALKLKYFGQGNSTATNLDDDDEEDGANGSSQLKLTRLYLQRRVFTEKTIGLKIHTANDSDSGLDEAFAKLDESTGVYKSMRPKVSLVSGKSGVNSSGQIYVGSQLKVSLSNTASYFSAQGESTSFSLYLTDSDGNVVDTAVEKDTSDTSGSTYLITLLWSTMTEDDLKDSYTLNVVMERRQTVTLNIGTSLSENATKDEISAMWSKITSTPTLYGYSETVSRDTATTPKHYSYSGMWSARVTPEANALETKIRDCDDSTTFTNLQYINFRMSEEDIILFNGRSYKGNENIYLSVADLAASNLVFYYYNKDSLTLEKTMETTILETGLYFDGNGNGKIDGYYNSETGYFVVDEDSGDENLGFIYGEFDEKMFQPVVKGDTVCQYFMKVYYTMSPRSLKAPPGASESDAAMVLPLFMSSVTDDEKFSELSTQQKSYRYLQAGDTQFSSSADSTDSSKGHAMYGAAATARTYVDIPLGGDTSPATYTETTEGRVYSWSPSFTGNLLVDYENPQPINHDKNITGESVAIAGEEPKWTTTSDGKRQLTVSDAGKEKLNEFLGSFVADTTFGIAVQEETTITSLDDIVPESVTQGSIKAIPNGEYLANTEGSGASPDADGDSNGKSSMSEFDSEMGISLPSTNFQLGDYAAIIMDGTAVGFSIGLPIIKGGKKVGEDAEKSDGNMADQIQNANEAMGTLRDFMSAVKDGTGKDAFKDIMKDDDYNSAKKNKADGKKEGISSKGFEVSFSVALAILFEYNPIDNTYYFKQASIAATAGLQFTLQYRFTPLPILYIYLKSGFELGIGTGLGVTRTAKAGDAIKTGSWLKKAEGLVVKDFEMNLSPGETVCFTLDMSETRGFQMAMKGNVFLEVIEADQVDAYVKDPNGYIDDGDYVNSGRLSSDGSEPVEVFLKDGNYTAYVVVTALEDTVIYSANEVSGAESVVYWNGLTISPSGFIEVGAGVGVELLKFELYLKAQLGMTFKFGGYSPDAESYQGAQMSSFDLAVSLGFNVTVLFINYSMDLIGYYLHGENTGDGSKWEGKWAALQGGVPVDRAGGGSSGSLVSVSAPTDTSDTQHVVGENGVSRAYDPTDDEAPFQLSGYGTTGDGFKLMDGLAVGNSYKVFRVGDDNYILYTRTREGAANALDNPQLVLSKVLLTGGKNTTRLQSPSGSGTYLAVDNDNAGDLDYSYSVSGNTLTVIWTAYDEASDASVSDTDTVAAAKRTVVKTASIDLSAGSPAFTTPTVISGTTTGHYRFLPQQEGNVSVYAEAYGGESTDASASGESTETEGEGIEGTGTEGTGTEGNDTENTDTEKMDAEKGNTDSESGESASSVSRISAFRNYMKAIYGLTDTELSTGVSASVDTAAAVYRWNYQKDLYGMHGSGTRLIARTADGTKVEKLLADETIENIETTDLGEGKILAAFSTVQYAYFGSDGKTVAVIDENTDLGAVKRLYIITFDGTEWGTARLLQTVVDFDACTGSSDKTGDSRSVLKDGIYSAGQCVTEQVDPYFSNLKFLNAKLAADSEAETVLLYEMGGNTYLINQASINAAADGSAFTVQPVFSSTEGTDAVIASDSNGNMAVVYTAPMSATGNNALFVAWWDTNLNTWGSGNVLAMNHLQVYEDGVKYGLTDEELEKAYLGETTGNKEYDAYIASDTTPDSAKGAMDQLTFANLQVTLKKVEDSEQLLVMTEGTLLELCKHTETGEILPANMGESNLGFYAVSFGAGKQGIGQANLTLTDYDFTAGSKLSGSLSFVNTGTSAIRASATEPATVTLVATTLPKDNSETDTSKTQTVTIASWPIEESIPSGGRVELGLQMTEGLTSSLTTGMAFVVSVTENKKYVGENAFSASSGSLLTVEAKPELVVDSADIELTGVSGENAVVETTMVVSNRGNADANNVYVELAYEQAGSDGETEYVVLDIPTSTIEVGAETQIQARDGGSTTTKQISLGALTNGYQRVVSCTLNVPLSAFRQDEISGLKLKIEVFSDADKTTSLGTGGATASAHSGEYCAGNNVATREIAQTTFFSAPKHIAIAMGNTLRLPLSYVSTSASGAEIEVREVSDGTDDSTAGLGILYFDEDSSTIVAAPAADTKDKTGIIQVEDLATNSIYSITYKISDLGSGTNVYKDDETFTFYEADGTKTDLTSKTEDWRFEENVPSWVGGTGVSEAPMNNDTVYAYGNNAYFTFTTVADTITLWFDGTVTVSSTLESATTVKDASSAKLRENSKYPLTVDFENDYGETHTVTIKAAAGTVIDRFTSTYSEKAEPIPTDSGSPRIYWSRSFPDTASIDSDSGTKVTLTCYVYDDTKLTQIGGIPEGTVITKTSERFWSFPLTISENGRIIITATDSSGKTGVYPLRVDWFNTQVTEGTISTFPGFSASDVSLVKQDGIAVTGPLNAGVLPYIRSYYTLKTGETIATYNEGGASVSPESDGRWKVTENGIYRVRVTAADGTWSQVLMPVDVIDDGTFTMQLQDDTDTQTVTVTVSGRVELSTLTVNGYDIMSTGKFGYTYGGEYVVYAKDSTGRELTSTITTDVPVAIADSAVSTTICSSPEAKDGTVSLSLSGISGGDYNATESQKTGNVYKAVYTATLLKVSGEKANPTEAAEKAATWKSAESGSYKFTGLAGGWYQLIVSDGNGNLARRNVFVEGLEVTDDATTRTLTITVDGGVTIKELTVNGYSVSPESAKFTYTYGGDYEIYVKDSTGREVRTTVTTDVPVAITKSAVKATICSTPDTSDGTVTLRLSGISGGDYNADASTPAENSYKAVYTATILSVTGENADPTAEAETAATWKSAESGSYKFENLATGWYQVIVSDGCDNLARRNIFVEALQVEDDTTARTLTISVSGGVKLKEITVNGYAISAEDGIFKYSFGGDYEIYVKDSTGREASTTFTTAVPVAIDADAVTMIPASTLKGKDGSISLSLSGISGGEYSAAASDPENNSYKAVYTVALLRVSGEDANPTATAEAAAEWKSVEDGEYLFEGLSESWYQLLVKDDKGNIARLNVFQDADRPSEQDYKINIDETDNGKVMVYPKTAAGGLRVTITVKPDSGYALHSLTVTGADGVELELTDKGDNTYTFIMPHMKVSVNARFVRTSAKFTDVSADAYYYDPVMWAVDEGITTGTDSTHFSPDGICTRAQAVTLLWRAAGSPIVKTEMKFTDVNPGAYYYEAVRWAASKGITKGTSETEFSPNLTCTRAQIVTFLWRSQGSPSAVSENPFTDVKSGIYYYNAVLWAVREGVTTGTTKTTFSPNNYCTRAEIVTFMHRALAE